MTDLEISKALALAIGWEPNHIRQSPHFTWVCTDRSGWQTWRLFDYKDWNVICPIAKRYGMAVDFRRNVAWTGSNSIGSVGNTPQKAIALEVIKRAKK